MDISDSQLEKSLERTEKRRLEAQAARSRQKRNIILAGVGVVLVVVLGGMAMGALSGAQKPKITTVALTWPHGEKEVELDAQQVGDGATILIKAGQPLPLAVSPKDTWDVTWKTADVQIKGDTYDWTPTGNSSDVTTSIRPRLSGWKKLLSFGLQTREIRLRGLAGTAPAGVQGGFLHDIETPAGGLWLHYRVLADAPVRYDDRAIKAFGEAANQLGKKQSDAVTSNTPIWKITPAFSGDKAVPNDTGTNAILLTDNLVADAKKAFTILNRLESKATIKVIVDENKSGAAGAARFRLSFDGKSGRFVWVQGAGKTKAQPEDWTEDVKVHSDEDSSTESTNQISASETSRE